MKYNDYVVHSLVANHWLANYALRQLMLLALQGFTESNGRRSTRSTSSIKRSMELRLRRLEDIDLAISCKDGDIKYAESYKLREDTRHALCNWKEGCNKFHRSLYNE